MGGGIRNERMMEGNIKEGCEGRRKRKEICKEYTCREKCMEIVVRKSNEGL